MPLVPIWLPLVVMAVDWVAVAVNWRRVEYVAKPAAMVALLIWLLAYPPIVPGAPLPWYDDLFAAGLVLSLIGDVLLMLSERFFIGGLVAFLLAHLAYIIGFNSGGLLLLPVTPLLVLVVGLISGWLVWRVSAALTASGHASLRLPVAIYAVVISLMLISALSTIFLSGWPLGEAAIVTTGAVLFYCSDALLAWNRFVAPKRGGKLLVIILYHLGQLVLIAGIAIHTMD